VRTVELNNEKLSANNSDMARLNTELSTWRTREKAVIARKKAIESVLIERQQFAENILGVIAERLPEDAVIYSIREIGWYEMEIQGWALSQSMVDRFNASLSRALDDWDMYIKDSPSEAKGLMGTDAFSGYAFTFSIEKQKS
jgi:Tfp pilus assembly protein PilN